MAAKKLAGKSTPKKRLNKKGVIEKAETEVRELLRQDRAGVLTRRKLDTGLKEIRRQLNVMEVHHFYK